MPPPEPAAPRPPTPRTVIIIPARYGSRRFPGKPLAKLAGETMLARVVAIARAAARAGDGDVAVYVTTEDARIAEHCAVLEVECLMTPGACPSGTDRVAAALSQLSPAPESVINLQGDAPLTPVAWVTALMEGLARAEAAGWDVVTPVLPLPWEALDAWRERKRAHPFSGTSAVFDATTGRALWFSKQILPAMRDEARLRAREPSPVYRHIGLYGYRRAALATFSALPESPHERLEGLEQLRLLTHGYRVGCLPVSAATVPHLSGVDSPEDLAHAEACLVGAEGDQPTP